MKSLVFSCCLLAAILLVKAQSEDLQFEGQIQQEGTGRYARSAYHYDGGSSGGGGSSSGGGHHDEVEYGAHTGDKGAFEWHTHHPVGHP